MKTRIFIQLFTVFLIVFSKKTFCQVGINSTGAAPAANAILDIASPNKGLLIPRVTTPNRIVLSGEGMVVFDTDTKTFWFHNGTTWVNNWVNSGNNIYNGNSGNVGIGTNNPTTKLDLNGSLKIVNGTQGNAKVLTSDPSGLATWQNLPLASGFPLNIPEIVHWKSAYSAATSYSENDLVSSATPNIYYYSLVNSNLNHGPESSPSFWQAVNFYQLKQIYKPLSLVLSQPVSLFTFPDATINFRGQIIVKHTANATNNGIAAGSFEAAFQYLKTSGVSGSNTYSDPNTKFGVGLNGLSVTIPTFNFSSGTVGLSTTVSLGVGQSLITNGIYFQLIPLGGQVGALTSPANISLTP
ncbi:MAG: hypothetical protein V4683_05180 [Bacteroidota bacterium]